MKKKSFMLAGGLCFFIIMWAGIVYSADRSDCQCTEYARCKTGMIIPGSGAKWDDNGPNLGYPLSSKPVGGGVINFEPGAYGADPTNGHVAPIVSYITDPKNSNNWIITVRDANWPAGTKVGPDCGCTDVYQHSFTIPKNSTKVHYIAAPAYNKFVNYKSGKCIDVSGGSTSDWAHLIEYTCSNDSNMYWKLDGVNVATAYGNDNYKYNAYYRIIDRKSGKCMDTNGGATSNGTNVIQYKCSYDSNQLWQPVNANSPLMLRNKKSGTCVDLKNGSTSDWTDLIINTCSGSTSELWKLKPQY